MKTKIQDMTSGSPGRLIILFAIPLMLGEFIRDNLKYPVIAQENGGGGGVSTNG